MVAFVGQSVNTDGQLFPFLRLPEELRVIVLGKLCSDLQVYSYKTGSGANRRHVILGLQDVSSVRLTSKQMQSEMALAMTQHGQGIQLHLDKTQRLLTRALNQGWTHWLIRDLRTLNLKVIGLSVPRANCLSFPRREKIVFELQQVQLPHTDSNGNQASQQHIERAVIDKATSFLRRFTSSNTPLHLNLLPQNLLIHGICKCGTLHWGFYHQQQLLTLDLRSNPARIIARQRED